MRGAEERDSRKWGRVSGAERAAGAVTTGKEELVAELWERVEEQKILRHETRQ